MGPTVAPTAVSPAAYSGGYPSFTMTGIIPDPIAAVSAAPAPVIPDEKSMATRVT